VGEFFHLSRICKSIEVGNKNRRKFDHCLVDLLFFLLVQELGKGILFYFKHLFPQKLSTKFCFANFSSIAPFVAFLHIQSSMKEHVRLLTKSVVWQEHLDESMCFLNLFLTFS
jgi:hypothetical protein